MSRMRSAVEWSKQMDLDDEEKAGVGVGGGERQRGTWEEVDYILERGAVFYTLIFGRKRCKYFRLVS